MRTYYGIYILYILCVIHNFSQHIFKIAFSMHKKIERDWWALYLYFGPFNYWPTSIRTAVNIFCLFPIGVLPSKYTKDTERRFGIVLTFFFTFAQLQRTSFSFKHEKPQCRLKLCPFHIVRISFRCTVDGKRKTLGFVAQRQYNTKTSHLGFDSEREGRLATVKTQFRFSGPASLIYHFTSSWP